MTDTLRFIVCDRVMSWLLMLSVFFFLNLHGPSEASWYFWVGGLHHVYFAPQIPHVLMPVLCDGHQLGDGNCVMVLRGTWLHMVCHRCHQHTARNLYIPHLYFWTSSKVMCLETVGAKTYTNTVPQSTSSCQCHLLHPCGCCCTKPSVVYCAESCFIDCAKTYFLKKKWVIQW